MRTRYRYLILAIAAAAALALAACGDDDDGPTATPEGAATDAPTATGSTLPTNPARNDDAGIACQTVSILDAVIALGEESTHIETTDDGDTCTYQTAERTLTVEIHEEESAEAADAAVEELAGDGDEIDVGNVGYRDGDTVTASQFQYVVTYTLDDADEEFLLYLGRSLERLEAPTPAPES